MDILAVSVWLRYLELCGEQMRFPDNGYRGDYIYDIAREEEIKADYARLVWEIENRLPALTRGLEEFTMLQRESRPVFENCFGALPL